MTYESCSKTRPPSRLGDRLIARRRRPASILTKSLKLIGNTINRLENRLIGHNPIYSTKFWILVTNYWAMEEARLSGKSGNFLLVFIEDSRLLLE